MSKSKKIIANIAFYLVLVLIYAVAIFGIVNKFNKETLFFFGNRVDIVLTDSMSVRNEHHADYLSDTTQIQPFDMIVSSAINEDTELKEKDCVLFKNPNYNNEVVVHRIVHIYEEGISFKVNNASKTTFNNEDVFTLDLMTGEMVMASLDYKKITVTLYTPSEYNMYCTIAQGKNNLDTTSVTTKVSEGVYKTEVSYERESSAPYKTFIAPAIDKDVYFSSVTYETSTSGTLSFSASELELEEDNSFKKYFNSYYLYEIRGDKSNSSDGVFERKDLISKVNKVIPKLGHVTHFLQSIPGIIMLAGLTVIITVASFFLNKPAKNKNKDDNSVKKEENNPKETE